MKRAILSVALVGAMAAGVSATRAADVDALAQNASKSLVEVEYTYRNENTPGHQETGQGIILNKEGVILIAGSLIYEGLPKAYITDIKVRAPGKKFKDVPATFLGRTSNRLFTFLKVDEDIVGEPLLPGDGADIKLGEEVVAVGMNGRQEDYKPYVGISRIKSIVPFVHEMGVTASFGLTRGNSPVYDMQSGKLVGITLPALPETMTMTLAIQGTSQTVPVQLRDEDQSSVFLPWSEIKDVFENIPTKPFDLRRPWIGLDNNGLTGLEEDMRKLYNIEQPSAVTVGLLIPGAAAQKAGIKPKDIVLAVNGKEFSKSIVPEIMVAQFTRALEQLKIGEEATLTVMRDGAKQDIKVTVEPSPKLGSEMPVVFNAKLGISTRDLAFFDTYNRKLSAETKGVMVALVKQGAPAALGSTPLKPGYLVTKINNQEVTSEQGFEEQLKKALDGTSEVVFVVSFNGDTQVCRIDLTK